MNAKNELIGFILILVLLWIIWFFTGGVARTDKDKPFVTQPTNIGDVPKPTNK